MFFFSVLFTTDFMTTVSIASEDYIRYLRGDDSIQVYLTASVPSNGQTHLATTHETIDLLKPDINLEVLGGDKILSGEALPVQVSFENPLDVELSGCQAYFDGSSIDKPVYDISIGYVFYVLFNNSEARGGL